MRIKGDEYNLSSIIVKLKKLEFIHLYYLLRKQKIYLNIKNIIELEIEQSKNRRLHIYGLTSKNAEKLYLGVLDYQYDYILHLTSDVLTPEELLQIKHLILDKPNTKTKGMTSYIPLSI